MREKIVIAKNIYFNINNKRHRRQIFHAIVPRIINAMIKIQKNELTITSRALLSSTGRSEGLGTGVESVWRHEHFETTFQSYKRLPNYIYARFFAGIQITDYVIISHNFLVLCRKLCGLHTCPPTIVFDTTT